MGALKEVGVREFRDHATKYLSGTESVAISRHGHIIGIYVPLKRDEEKARQAWDDFGKAIDQVLQETGITEDELADLLDLSKPLP
jgi:hypothetical protein